MLSDLGFDVQRQPQGANIDLKAQHPGSGLGFAMEVTGTKGTIQKDSKKIVQAWQYVTDRAGTPDENDRLMVIANTETHLDPRQRSRDSFSQPVVNLLGKHDVLLITTIQLYELWKSVHENTISAQDAVQRLYNSTGLYR